MTDKQTKTVKKKGGLNNSRSGSFPNVDEQIANGTKRTNNSPDNFDYVRKLGSGGCGVVWLVQDKRNGKLYAQKMIQIERSPIAREQKRNRELFAEINILENIESDFIVMMLEYFSEKNMMYVLLEFMDVGCLRSVLNEIVFQKKDVPETIIAQIAQQALFGLEVLHKHVIHRDIKPGNLLLNSKGQVKIADPGVAGNTKRRRFTPLGTRSYMSPERMWEKEHHANSDVWGLGLSLLELSLKAFPVKNSEDPFNTIGLLEMISTGRHLAKERESHSEEFRDFINQMLQKDPNIRPSATEMLKHQFLEKNLGKRVSLREWLAELMKKKKEREKEFYLQSGEII